MKRKKKICYCSCCYISLSLSGTYTVVLWTTDKYSAGMDGDVSIRFIGDKCQTGWHDLDHVWINDFERAARDEFTFHDNDIGSKVK